MSTDHLKKPKTQAAMARIGNIMANQIAPTFQAGALVTVIVRFPGEPECDFFMSDRAETIAELRAFLDRCDKRDQLDHTTDGVVASAPPWDASQIKPPGWDHVFAAFVEGAREARANPEAGEDDFRRAADGHTKRVFEEVDPVSEAALRTGSWRDDKWAMLARTGHLSPGVADAARETATGMPRLDPVAAVDSFDGITGRPPNPCKLTECQGKPRCEKCVKAGLNVPDGVQASRPMQPTPYGLAGIEGDAIVIRLTADACAFAFANDPQAREPRPPVIDKAGFLRDTLNELTAEREDGSTPLTDMLERAMVKAMENGSDALDHDATDGVAPSQGARRHPKCVNPDCNCVMRCEAEALPIGVMASPTGPEVVSDTLKKLREQERANGVQGEAK